MGRLNKHLGKGALLIIIIIIFVKVTSVMQWYILELGYVGSRELNDGRAPIGIILFVWCCERRKVNIIMNAPLAHPKPAHHCLYLIMVYPRYLLPSLLQFSKSIIWLRFVDLNGSLVNSIISSAVGQTPNQPLHSINYLTRAAPTNIWQI